MLSIFPWPFYIKKKTKQNIFEKNWNGFSLEMGFLKVGCALKFLSITFLSTFLEGSFHQQPCECNSSKHWFYSCSYGEWQRGGGISSCSPLAALARGRCGKVLGYRWKQYVPTRVPRASVSPFLPPYPSSRVNPNPCKCAAVRGLSSIGRITVSSEAGGGDPSPRRRGDQVTPQRTCNPEAPSSFGCTDLGLVVGWPWGPWSCAEEPGTSGPRGFLCWHILPSSLSLRTLASPDSRDVPPTPNTHV